MQLIDKNKVRETNLRGYVFTTALLSKILENIRIVEAEGRWEEFDLAGFMKQILSDEESLKAITDYAISIREELDFEKGGELAANLNDLYNYVTRRLLHINLRNDLVALDEIYGIITEIREAWKQVPTLVPATTIAPSMMN